MSAAPFPFSILALPLLLALCACVGKAPELSSHLSPSTAALWDRYAVVCVEAEKAAAPYRVRISLRYGAEGDTRRVTALLWGNPEGELRLDVSAGVGVTLASIFEKDEHFLVYAPNDRRAYFHQGKEKPLLNVGVPVPLGVGDLAALLNGRFGRVFGLSYSGAPERGSQGMAYALDSGRLSGALTLNAKGLPVLWRELSQGWTLRLTYEEEGPPLPQKIEISHPDSQKAVVLVKERNRPAVPFTESQLRLILPEDTPVLPIRRFRQARD